MVGCLFSVWKALGASFNPSVGEIKTSGDELQVSRRGREKDLMDDFGLFLPRVGATVVPELSVVRL